MKLNDCWPSLKSPVHSAKVNRMFIQCVVAVPSITNGTKTIKLNSICPVVRMQCSLASSKLRDALSRFRWSGKAIYLLSASASYTISNFCEKNIGILSKLFTCKVSKSEYLCLCYPTISRPHRETAMMSGVCYDFSNKKEISRSHKS